MTFTSLSPSFTITLPFVGPVDLCKVFSMTSTIAFLISQADSNKALYSPGKLSHCLESIRSGEVPSRRAAARLFGIPRSTIVSKPAGNEM